MMETNVMATEVEARENFCFGSKNVKKP